MVNTIRPAIIKALFSQSIANAKSATNNKNKKRPAIFRR